MTNYMEVSSEQVYKIIQSVRRFPNKRTVLYSVYSPKYDRYMGYGVCEQTLKADYRWVSPLAIPITTYEAAVDKFYDLVGANYSPAIERKGSSNG